MEEYKASQAAKKAQQAAKPKPKASGEMTMEEYKADQVAKKAARAATPKAVMERKPVPQELPEEQAVPKEEPKEEPKEVPKEEPKSAAQTKKDKKKGDKADDDDDDDFEAALAEEGVKAPAAAESAGRPATEADTKAKPAEGDDNEEGLDAKTLANRRKKDKKKAKHSGVGGGGFFGGDDDKPEVKAGDKEADEDEEDAPKDEPKAKGKAKAKPKAESAMVRKIREELEAKKALEEERHQFEAEQKRLIDEEERRIKDEEDAEEAERTRKREARLAKIAKAKADGTFQTKAEKERKARAAVLREQFGFQMGEGDDDEEQPAGEEAKKPAKGPLAVKLTKKKREKGEKPQDDDGAAKAAAEAKAKAEEEAKDKAKAKAEEEATAKAKGKAAAEEDGEDWEEVAEKLEKAEEAKEAESSDSESGSDDEGSDSGSDSSGSSSDSFIGYRSPILVIMGHVDTGKTKLLDKIRKTNVQEGEAGGITQQIGATYFPDIALLEQTKKVDPDFDIEVPGVMIIDTPGHEAFNNLRARGSSLCDMAILVIDIMHGLEPQTVESLNMLKKRKCFFVIAMNKIDVCYNWNSKSYTSIKDALGRQEQDTMDDFNNRYQRVVGQLNEQGLNVELYWKNDDPRTTVSIVPTSAITGEGVPDLLYLMLRSAQQIMPDKLEIQEELQCTVIEVKNIEGMGTTIDVVLVNGTLRVGDQIVIAGITGPIVTTIRALKTPHPMKEIRVKNEYVDHQSISTSMGIKICAPDLEQAVAGAELMVVGPDDDIEEMKEEVMEGFDSILQGFEKQTEGVYVKASTLGSLEALLTFLTDMKIPVFDVGIGEVHKKDVKKACIMKEKKHPEYAVILAFDIKINAEAKAQADHDGVVIMEADIIYNLKDKFEKYMEKVKESKKTEKKEEAIFPVILEIDKQYIFHKTNPIVVGCNVKGGQLRVGTPLCLPDKDNLCIGRVLGIEKDRKSVKSARTGESVCVKIEQNTAQQHILYGRHFDHTSLLYSAVTRGSIDVLKELYKDEMKKEDWELIIGMKKVFNIS